MRHVLWRVTQVLGGLLAGLVLAEVGFRYADDDAFPHLNLYVSDPKVGARLRPGGTERIAYAGNPVTSFRINAEGYRGEDWGPPAPDEIVVIGDSQVFGLGVEENETASAELARRTGRPVRNAGTPTWGPMEYLAIEDELLAARHPKDVVMVLNFANDLFEVDTPNTERHAIWDGWAVRLETAPEHVTDFPGRTWLYNQSHLFFAMRRAWWAPPSEWGQGFSSEGTWARVIDTAKARTAPTDPRAEDAVVAASVKEAANGRAHAERDLTDLYFRVFPEIRRADEGIALEAVARNAQPGDIVSEHYGEEGARTVAVTAALLRQGGQLRTDLEKRLGEWADAHPEDKRSAAIKEAIASRTQTDAQLSDLAHRVAVELGGRSPLLDFVKEARDRAEKAGANLLVVALPIDVQVSDTEWAKYGEEVQDMSGTRVLLTDLVTGAERLGVRALDLTETLAAAEPGAFLDKDIHLTAKGQAAAGAAIAAGLAASFPVAIPGPGLEPGRSRVPTMEELALAPEIVVAGSTAAHCSTRQLREWLYVWCTTRHGTVKVDDESFGYGGAYYEGEPVHPLGVAVRVGEEVLTGADGADYQRSASLLTPLVPGREVRADFWWTDRAEQLSVTWDGETPVMGFSPLEHPGKPPAAYACRDKKGNRPWVGDATRGCADTYADCEEQRDCAAGTRGHLPTCVGGQVNAGSAGHCHTLCNAEHPCARGTCADWVGGRVCL